MSQSRVWDNLNMPHQAGEVKEEETVWAVYLRNPNRCWKRCCFYMHYGGETEEHHVSLGWLPSKSTHLPQPKQTPEPSPHSTSAPGSSVVLARPEPDETKGRAHVTCTWRWAGAVKISLICTSASKPLTPPNGPRCSLLVCCAFQGFWCISKVQIGDAKMFMTRTSKITEHTG